MSKLSVGTHIRLIDTLDAVIERAHVLEVPYFQTFVVTSEGKRYTAPEDEMVGFREKKQLMGVDVYVHLSYWVNLAAKNNKARHVLEREVKFAEKLGINTVVLHPGTATGFEMRQDGIEELVKHLKYITKKFPKLTVLLENVAHGKKNIGGDLEDFFTLFSMLGTNKNVQFCFDTAHAFSYGYDMTTEEGQDAVVRDIERYIGFERVALIHLNDTTESLGSKIDRHEAPGKGSIGETALKRFINLQPLKSKRIITELPPLSIAEEKESLEQINTWRR